MCIWPVWRDAVISVKITSMADPKKISGPSDARPALDDGLSAADFRDFYWMGSGIGQ
jgi:hypothetical protein